MKQCPFCKKELPDETTFCPYCMQRLTEVKEISCDQKKPNKKLWWITIPVIIVLLFGGLFALWMSRDRTPAPTPPASSAGEEEKKTNTETKDYSDYLGVWISKEITTENTEQQYGGGTTLEIITIKNGVIRFNLTRVSSALNRIARIENITAEIVDDIATFSFQDDGWQNSGTGKLKFNSEEIYVETTVLEENTGALWSMHGNAYLTKREDSIRNLDNNYLLAEFRNIRDDFGEETQESTVNMFDFSEAHHFGELSINVDPEDGIVLSFGVDYQESDNKARYTFRGIDGNSTVEDVIKIMGQPVTGKPEKNGEIGYGMQNGFIKFLLDEQMNVVGIAAFSPRALD